MEKEKVSASGERAAIGGYLPQFDEFSRFVYEHLIKGDLEWVKIADPEAEKLDDIQYSIKSEIHAYQVKWTIADATISYQNFTALLPLITASWKNIKSLNPTVKVVPHLITNKPPSNFDSIKSSKDGSKIGSFQEFLSEAWVNLISSQDIENKWDEVIEDIKKKSLLDKTEFEEFVKCFDFHSDYKPNTFRVKNVASSKEDEDLIYIGRYLFEKAASTTRVVKYTRKELVEELSWESRFNTYFNHELVVDQKKYQPIQTTLDSLDSTLAANNGGYFFLIGGPGTGKSTLLTEWSRSRSERIIKYYAFDFTNASSYLNNHQRGDSTFLFFDLVCQLKEAGIYKGQILPYKDLSFLRKVFYEQLEQLGKEFKETGSQTVFIIDGLDHVPREYRSASNNFIEELPLPANIPEGVFFILGSQSYDLDEVSQEVKAEYNSGLRTVNIDPLGKGNVFKYIEACDINPPLEIENKNTVFEKSQGHPLYLSYLMGRIVSSDNREEVFEDLISIDGDIGNYYTKMWEPIEQDGKLIELLGLISRVKGDINPLFVNEWDFESTVHKSFYEKAKFLFNQGDGEWSFFHNSFKQFLLHQTAFNFLTQEYDPSRNQKYHEDLAHYYDKSKVESIWNKNYHFYQSGNYEEFLKETTPESFTSQLLDYRPIEGIKQDARLGIEIARNTNDVKLLVRYLFVLAEIENRLNNIDPASLTRELLEINKPIVAKKYLRAGNVLLCNTAYALQASKIFIEFGLKNEGAVLYNLAHPSFIHEGSIIIDDSMRYEEFDDILEEWIQVVHHFADIESIIALLNNISDLVPEERKDPRYKGSNLRINLIDTLGYSLITNKKWNELDRLLQEFRFEDKTEDRIFFSILEGAIETCIDISKKEIAIEYLDLLFEHFDVHTLKPIGKIFIADLEYKVKGDIKPAYELIKELGQPSNVGHDRLGYNDSFEPFIPLIKFNKLLNISGNGVSITDAIPNVEVGTDEEVMVEFERMICLIVQIYSDGISVIPNSNIVNRVSPIARYYYRDSNHRNIYWYKLTQVKGEYFDFLIEAVSLHGKKELDDLAKYIFNEFIEHPKYWHSGIQRKILRSLLKYGYNNEELQAHSNRIQDFMLGDCDIDGRITECVEQSKLWRDLGDIEQSEVWIKNSIKESIGIGYRKDYQFSTWVNWMDRINTKSPDKAPDRILWFLSHLKHIKETTEGRAYWDASQKLLKSCFNWNFSAGFVQLKWQLENGLIEFEEGVSCFIEYYLKNCTSEVEYRSIVELYSELFIFISEVGDLYILKRILNRGYDLLDEKFLKQYLPTIIDSINIRGIEEYKHSLLKEVEEFVAEKNVDVKDYYSDFILPNSSRADDNRTSGNELVLKNVTERIPESEVLERANDYSSFKELVEQEDKANSFFKWSPVIKKIAPQLSGDNIKEIVSIVKTGNRKSDFFALMSEVSLSIGEKDLALDLAKRSLDSSSESGWVKHYDGGTRVNAFKAFQEIDPTESSKVAFDTFSYDILSSNYPNSYIEYIEDIVPLLSENYNEEEIWEEVYIYLQGLMSNSNQITDLPILNPEEVPIRKIYSELLFYFAEYPTRLISKRARVLLAREINNENKYTVNSILNTESSSYNQMEISNDVLSFSHKLEFPELNKLTPVLLELSTSKDYSIRNCSQSILTSLNIPLPEINSSKPPEIYSLHLSEPQRVDFEKEINPEFPEINLKDPFDIIRPFEFYIDVLSKESGVDSTNLIYRTYAIMKTIGDPEEWTLNYEKNVRSNLEEIDLKYSFPRPRVICVRRAIMNLITELIDSNIIDISRTEDVFRSYDYLSPLFNDSIKPQFIDRIIKKETRRSKEWVEDIEKSDRFNESIQELNGSNVIAEFTEVKSLDWGSATEVFLAQLASIRTKKETQDYIFGSVFQQKTEEYHQLSTGSSSIIVIRDHRYDQFDIKSKWIAINPVFARYLGWEPDDSKLFAWKDKSGVSMVESAYWLSGNAEMSPPHLYSEAGSGWYVMASNEAIEQIKKVEPNLVYEQVLTRCKHEDSIKYESTFSKEFTVSNT